MDYLHYSCKQYWFYGLGRKRLIEIVQASEKFEEYESPDHEKNYFRAWILNRVNAERFKPLKNPPQMREHFRWFAEYKVRK